MRPDRIVNTPDSDTINDLRGGNTELQVMVSMYSTAEGAEGALFLFLKHHVETVTTLSPLNRAGGRVERHILPSRGKTR